MTLFEQPAPAKTQRPDVLSITARQKLNLPETHTVCGWQRMHDGVLVTMQEEYVKASGKNKGQTSWRGKKHQCFVSYTEIEAAEKAWEQSTGKCSTCGGDGIQQYGWSRELGALLRRCAPCGGKGNAAIANKTNIESNDAI